MANIPISEVTSGTVTGTGYFDELMTAVTVRLEEQHKLGRIKGADYSTVYLGAMQYAMQQAILFALQKQKADQEADLLGQKFLTEVEQTLLVQKQQALYQKQTDGFDRDAEQKAVKIWTDVWTIARSTDPDATAVALPTNISTGLNVVLEELLTRSGLTDPTP